MISKITPEHAEKFLTFFKKLVEQDPERVERISDVEKITIEQERKFIQKLLEKEEHGEMMIKIGEVDGQIVFEGEIERLPRWIERHVAEIRFGMIPNTEAVAREAMKGLISNAQKKGIELLIYFHLKTQTAGIALVKEFGFEESGTIKNYYKRGAEYIDRVYFTKKL